MVGCQPRPVHHTMVWFFTPGAALGAGAASGHGEDLGPDHDHAEKEDKRGKRGSFLDDVADHGGLPNENREGTMFYFCS
jgi:hypothetical protein